MLSYWNPCRQAEKKENRKNMCNVKTNNYALTKHAQTVTDDTM